MIAPMRKLMQYKGFRFLRILIINLLILLCLMELLFIGYYYVIDQAYVSVPDKLASEKSSFDVEKQKTVACNKHNNILAPHPYLVFVHTSRPECRSFSNNTGHRGPEVPLVRRPDYYTVMILGGSVANQIFQFKSEEIRAYFQEKYPGRQVVILNGSLEGWKQPQQLFMLQMYGEVIDAAISIEGFNEMIFNYRQGYQLRFDTPFIPGYRKANPGFLSTRERVVIDISAWLFDVVNDNRVLRRSKAAYFISDTLRSALEHHISDHEAPTDSLEHLSRILPLPAEWGAEQKKQHALEQYLKYLSLMNATAKNFGIPLAVFLQPAPALHKPLSSEELNVVGDLAYRDDYQWFEQQLLAHKKNLPVISMLDVFASTPATIYKDGIHYHKESEGPTLIVNRIQQELNRRW